MKVLFIKDKLEVGGTTSSFLSLLNALSKRNDIIVFTWINNISIDEKGLLPTNIFIYENCFLRRAFSRPKSKISRLIQAIKNDLLFDLLRIHYLRFKKHSNRKTMKFYQAHDIKRASKQCDVDLKEFDIVISWEELYPCYILSLKIKCNKKIAWIHPDYISAGFNSHQDHSIFSRLDSIVSVSSAGRNSLIKSFPDLRSKFTYVENCIDPYTIRIKAKILQSDIDIMEDRFKIVTVARLQNVSKALDRAVRIAHKLKEEHLNFCWYFIGEGEDRKYLEELVKKLNLENCVYFLGHKHNPYPYIEHADLFVLQSHYEGKPVVVSESLIIGTPVLVTNYESAMEQVSENYGIVSENNENEISKSIRDLITQPELIMKYKENLRHLDLSIFENIDSFITLMGGVLFDDD